MSKDTTRAPRKQAVINGNGQNNEMKVDGKPATRLPVLKTYKLYIGGQFPRTESGRYYQPADARGVALANVCRGSRKDVRDAVAVARKAFGGWSARSAYNRGQILYRIGEVLEGRSDQFIDELALHGMSMERARTEVATSVDRCIHYAGWCDKYQALFSSVNPISSSHFNFSVQEPSGVVALMADGANPLSGLIGMIAPAIAGGNTCVVVASEAMPLPSITLSEVLATSDLPGGVVNIITGFRNELLKPLVSHMDVNALVVAGATPEERAMLDLEAASNLKRVIYRTIDDWSSADGQSPYFILDTQEVKTTWHPIEKGQGGAGGY